MYEKKINIQDCLEISTNPSAKVKDGQQRCTVTKYAI